MLDISPYQYYVLLISSDTYNLTEVNYYNLTEANLKSNQLRPWLLYTRDIIIALFSPTQQNRQGLNVINVFVFHLVSTVQFDQSIYRVNEDDGSIQISLFLSNPSSSVITADVLSTSDSATGE